MGGRSVIAFGLAAGLALVFGAVSQAGMQADPNISDEPQGKSGGLRYSSDSNAFDPLNFGFASVDSGCGPPSWHRLGGGSSTFGDPAESYLQSGRPVDFGDVDDDPDEGFGASGIGLKGGTVTAYSICRKGGGIKYVRKEIADGTSAGRTAIVRCGGPRLRVTSGTFGISPAASWTNSSHPLDGADNGKVPDDGWQGRVRDGAGGPGGFTAYATCTRSDRLGYEKTKPVSIAEDSSRKRSAHCANDQQVVGGGVKISGPIIEARLIANEPRDDGDPGSVPDDGWRGGAANIAGGSKQLTVYAVCRR